MHAHGGAYMMAIKNKNIQAHLKLPFIEKRKVLIAHSSLQKFDVLGIELVKFANHTRVYNAFLC